MFITRKHLSRRTLLRGMGVGLSLPLLDAMIPAATALAGTAAAPKPRLGFFYFPHGAVMENWTPEGEGRDFQLKPISEPLAPFRNQLTILSNLGNKPGESRAVHALVPATWLSCVHPQEGLEPNMAATVDQIAAQVLPPRAAVLLEVHLEACVPIVTSGDAPRGSSRAPGSAIQKRRVRAATMDM